MATRHKHLELDQKKLDRARRLLGVATERETVETALDMILAEEAIVAARGPVALTCSAAQSSTPAS